MDRSRLGCGMVALIVMASPAIGQEEAKDRRPHRTRVALGPQLVPRYPGAEGLAVRPFIDVARARGNDDFEFEAPDESAGFSVVRAKGFSAGPAFNFEGSRRSRHTDGLLSEVGRTFELGAFVEYNLTDEIRLRAEGRKGIGGHRGWVGMVGADYVLRDHDNWLVSVGPRVTIADDQYVSAYYDVSPDDSVRSGLPVNDAGAGVQAVGGTIGVSRQFDRHWGVLGYAKYDRLTGDAAQSPVVNTFGSRNQFSTGLALSYTFD